MVRSRFERKRATSCGWRIWRGRKIYRASTHNATLVDGLREVAQIRVCLVAARSVRDLPSPQPRQNPARDPRHTPAPDHPRRLPRLAALAPRGVARRGDPRGDLPAWARRRGAGEEEPSAHPRRRGRAPQPRPLARLLQHARVGVGDRLGAGRLRRPRGGLRPLLQPLGGGPGREGERQARRLIARARRPRQRQRAPSPLARQRARERAAQ